MTIAEMEASLERILGVRVRLDEPAGGSGLVRRLVGRNTRLAARYRDGRIFIAGDAAHTSHGPTLNLALQDAANLAWKLGATIAGWAPEGLLDSYEAERHAAGEREIMWTQAETALMAPGGDVTALRSLFGEVLAVPDNLRRIVTLMAGADTRYDMGETAPCDLTGWFVPPLTLNASGGGTVRLAELLRDGHAWLIDSTPDHRLAAVAERPAGRVNYLAVESAAGSPSLLVRPDGYVAWSGTETGTAIAAVERWFGRG